MDDSETVLRRGAALEEIARLRDRRKVIKQEITPLKEKAALLRESYQPVIDRLQAEADRLAREFRRLYEESQNAFAEDDRGLAKALSLQGKTVQTECESLNTETNQMRAELKGFHDRIDGLFRELRESRERIEMLEVALREIQRPRVQGFDRANVSWIEVEQFLDQLPQRALKEIERIEFLPECPLREEGGGKLGDMRWDPKTRKAFVRMYRHESFAVAEEDEKTTVAHEIGHEIFLKYLTVEEKRIWEELYCGSGDWFVSRRAVRSLEEDFCECLAKFFVDPTKLAGGDSRKYTFIEGVVKRLEQKL